MPQHRSAIVKFFILPLFLVSLSFNPASADQQKHIWRLQSVWPVGSAMYPALLDMCKKVNTRAQGRIEIKLFVPGEIVATLDVMDALRHNVIQMAATSGIYNSARVPEGLIEFGLPFGLENPGQFETFWYHYQGGRNFQMLQEAYREKGVELLRVNAGTSYGYMTKFPVAHVADFRGKKIRSFGFFGAVVDLMGGVPVSLPTEDQYLALQEGMVDGTIFPFMSMETMRFKEVSKHMVMPPALGAPSSDIIVSRKAFEQLNPDLKEILRQEAKAHSELFLSMEAPREVELLANPDKHGVVINRLPNEEVDELRERCQVIWNRVGARNERTQRLVSNLKAYLTDRKTASR